MAVGEGVSESGNGDPGLEAEASGLAADTSGKEGAIGQTIMRPLRLEQLDRGVERLAGMSGDQIERLLARGIATPLAAIRHARTAGQDVAVS